MIGEILEVSRRELMVITSPQPGEVVVIENMALEVMEVAKQGEPGPPPTFDIDLALIYATAKL